MKIIVVIDCTYLENTLDVIDSIKEREFESIPSLRDAIKDKMIFTEHDDLGIPYQILTLDSFIKSYNADLLNTDETFITQVEIKQIGE